MAEPQDHKVLKVLPELKDCREQLAHKAKLEPLVHKEPPEYRD